MMVYRRKDCPCPGEGEREESETAVHELARELGQSFSGPILFYYVWWILWEAKQRGLRRLYFLARDGYTLKKIAELFCEKFSLGIECRYLYCSRASLRMPTYFFIGEEAFDLLLLGGYRVTLKSLLQRGELTDEERKAVYEECGMQGIHEEKILSRGELADYTKKIRQSNIYKKCILTRSQASYENAVGYFQKQGLMDQSTVAVVDSGWTGSMQRSLRQLLEFAGYSGHFLGFYFGMYNMPKSRCDGEYLTWYFNASTSAEEKALFCNNLFECLLSAPHGMTVSYHSSQGEYQPVLLPTPKERELNLICDQSEAICLYARSALSKIDFSSFDGSSFRQETKKIIKRYMFKPTQEEVAYYGQFLFCDDVTESYRISLANKEQMNTLKRYSIPYRLLFRVMRRRPKTKEQADLFWPYGTITFLPPVEEWWYRINVYSWEWLRQKVLAQRYRHYDEGPNIDKFYQIIDRHDIVSFDIFDTLLYRTVNKPVDVFRLMEPWAEKSFGIRDFAEKRIEAEREARNRTDDEEITLFEIYRALGVMWSDKEAAALQQYECETELAVLRRDDVAAKLLSYSVNAGKRVLIISDMYQDVSFIKTALERVGIDTYDGLYVSSSEKATKAAGTLFQKVAEKENIKDLSRWLHIGDNLYSDYASPKAVGLSAMLYDNGRGVYTAAMGGTCYRRILRKATARIRCQLIRLARQGT